MKKNIIKGYNKQKAAYEKVKKKKKKKKKNSQKTCKKSNKKTVTW